MKNFYKESYFQKAERTGKFGIGIPNMYVEPKKGGGSIDQVWEYFRMWSYVSVERPDHPWYPAHIVVTSKGERVPVGDFLTEDEKEDLVSNLERIIQELK